MVWLIRYTLYLSEEHSRSPFFSESEKMKVLVDAMTVVIKIGKYLPWIVVAFASVNFTLAVLDFTVWNNIAGGIFNSILAFGGFVFFGQLFKRRKIHRYEYRYTGKHLQRVQRIGVEEEERFAATSRSEET
jgi:hypothetical protein